MSAVVICTKNATCLPVMAASITFYLPQFFDVYISGSDIVLPRHRTINSTNEHTNFGDAYNAVVNQVWDDGHADVIVANDDIVLTPYTWQMMKEDLSVLDKPGWVGARADYARGWQNIRHRHATDRPGVIRFDSESKVIEVPVIAPYFAYISKESWVDFPPINWYSDDIQCRDISENGYKHYISRAYVHHVGSQTCGLDYQKCMEDARPWIEANRPELAKVWFKTS